jgi:hypothetical protein
MPARRHHGIAPRGTLRLLTLAAVLLCGTAGLASAQDADSDGVPDNKDACPNSVRASGEHVDAHGCTHLQIDADLDGWCNPDRPRDANNRWLETKDEWCVGIDNCKFVPNPAFLAPSSVTRATLVSPHGVAGNRPWQQCAWFPLSPCLRARVPVLTHLVLRRAVQRAATGRVASAATRTSRASAATAAASSRARSGTAASRASVCGASAARSATTR